MKSLRWPLIGIKKNAFLVFKSIAHISWPISSVDQNFRATEKYLHYNYRGCLLLTQLLAAPPAPKISALFFFPKLFAVKLSSFTSWQPFQCRRRANPTTASCSTRCRQLSLLSQINIYCILNFIYTSWQHECRLWGEVSAFSSFPQESLSSVASPDFTRAWCKRDSFATLSFRLLCQKVVFLDYMIPCELLHQYNTSDTNANSSFSLTIIFQLIITLQILSSHCSSWIILNVFSFVFWAGNKFNIFFPVAIDFFLCRGITTDWNLMSHVFQHNNEWNFNDAATADWNSFI